MVSCCPVIEKVTWISNLVFSRQWGKVKTVIQRHQAVEHDPEHGVETSYNTSENMLVECLCRYWCGDDG